ncbi:hypothetical protein ACRBC4_02355 [Helicobacter pylori]|uniref:hypothetical protein n=2 Tax=Helicobacter pylori TaxID=210 RepID=UPI003D68E255
MSGLASHFFIYFVFEYNPTKTLRNGMEFLGLLLSLAAILIAFKKPEKENWAFGILMVVWLVELIIFIAHSSSVLPNINL